MTFPAYNETLPPTRAEIFLPRAEAAAETAERIAHQSQSDDWMSDNQSQIVTAWATLSLALSELAKS